MISNLLGYKCANFSEFLTRLRKVFACTKWVLFFKTVCVHSHKYECWCAHAFTYKHSSILCVSIS